MLQKFETSEKENANSQAGEQANETVQKRVTPHKTASKLKLMNFNSQQQHLQCSLRSTTKCEWGNVCVWTCIYVARRHAFKIFSFVARKKNQTNSIPHRIHKQYINFSLALSFFFSSSQWASNDRINRGNPSKLIKNCVTKLRNFPKCKLKIWFFALFPILLFLAQAKIIIII